MSTHEETLDPDDLNRPDWNSLVNNYDKHDIGEAYFVGRAEQMGLTVEHWGIDKRHHDDHLIFDNKMDLRLWEPLDGQDYAPSEPKYGKPMWAEIPEVEREFVVPEPVVSDEATLDEPQYYDEIGWSLKALVDVKTKSNEDWMGAFNLRHLAHYAEHASNHAMICPSFVYMTMVDVDAEMVGRSNIIAPIPHDWEWGTLVDHYDRDTDFSLDYGDIKDIARECSLVDRTFRAPDGNLVIEMDESQYIDFSTLHSRVVHR